MRGLTFLCHYKVDCMKEQDLNLHRLNDNVVIVTNADTLRELIGVTKTNNAVAAPQVPSMVASGVVRDSDGNELVPRAIACAEVNRSASTLRNWEKRHLIEPISWLGQIYYRRTDLERMKPSISSYFADYSSR